MVGSWSNEAGEYASLVTHKVRNQPLTTSGWYLKYRANVSQGLFNRDPALLIKRFLVETKSTYTLRSARAVGLGARSSILFFSLVDLTSFAARLRMQSRRRLWLQSLFTNDLQLICHGVKRHSVMMDVCGQVLLNVFFTYFSDSFDELCSCNLNWMEISLQRKIF